MESNFKKITEKKCVCVCVCVCACVCAYEECVCVITTPKTDSILIGVNLQVNNQNVFHCPTNVMVF